MSEASRAGLDVALLLWLTKTLPNTLRYLELGNRGAIGFD